jgi:hypothetical protein
MRTRASALAFIPRFTAARAGVGVLLGADPLVQRAFSGFWSQNFASSRMRAFLLSL